MRVWPIVVALLLSIAPPAASQSDPADAWSDWGAVLARYASGERVQYARWKAENPAEWRRFLAWLETAEPSRMSPADQRAFWINAYNARVVAGMLSRYPIDSIKDVGFLGGRIRGFFGREEHRVAGRDRSLDARRGHRLPLRSRGLRQSAAGSAGGGFARSQDAQDRRHGGLAHDPRRAVFCAVS